LQRQRHLAAKPARGPENQCRPCHDASLCVDMRDGASKWDCMKSGIR
jgi:hypothetical protein